MEQTWRDLLFMHWPIKPALIRALIPMQLEIDTFERFAWVSITPFHMAVRIRGFFRILGMDNIPELNFRTYVVGNGTPGVFFFSLDAASRLAVWGARALYHLPYFYAWMRVRNSGDSICYSSIRRHARWRGKYHPKSSVRYAGRGSIDYFLAERYCLFSVWNGQIYRGDIHHLPWPLQEASVSVEDNTIGLSAGIPVSGAPPYSSFARELQVLIWPLTAMVAR